MLLNCRRGGRGGIFFNSELELFFFDDLHLQIIASISPKASVEYSSAQWAIFYPYGGRGLNIFHMFC